MIVKSCINPSDIEIQVMDRVLLPLGFEAMQVCDFFVFPSNTVCEHLFRTMDVMLGTNYFEHQRSFLDLFRFSRPSQ